MTTNTTTRKIPTPLFAAAGAGDLAYEQLRKLPAQVAELRSKVTELRPAVTEAVSETNLRADLDRLRGVARRNAANILANAQAGAQVAQDRAFAVYTDLVARGEKVVSTARGTELQIEIEPAERTVTAGVTTPGKPATRASSTASTPAKKAGTVAKKTTAAKK
jgi:hypothetical protein